MSNEVTKARNEERDIIAAHLFREAEDCRARARETEGEISLRYHILADELGRQAKVVRGGAR
jgi:hypothetical protein